MKVKLLLLLVLAGSLFGVAHAVAQSRAGGTISGRVVGPDGKPLVGASVEIVRTTRGAVTDNNGAFRFDNIQGGGATVKVSFLGYKARSVAVSVGRPQVVALQSADVEAETVVVTGMFNRPGNSFTGAAKSNTAAELQRVGSGNIFQSLKNLDPSLSIPDNLDFGSDPNKMPTVELRGQSGFPLAEDDGSLVQRSYQSDPNQPLYILDGFEVDATRIFDLDQNRVQSVTILKDAAAKAMYGAKAANGVIVVETKRNSGRKLAATYRASIDITMPDLTSYDLTSAIEKLQVEKMAGIYEQNATVSTQLENQGIYNRRLNAALAGTNTDWLSKPLRTGIGTRHSLELDATEGRLSALLNLSYSNVTGVMKDSKRNTISGGMDIAYRQSKKFVIRNKMNITSNKGVDSPWGSFTDYANMNPYHAPYDENGYLIKEYDNISGKGAITNPIWNTQFNTSLVKTYLNFSDNIYAELFPLKGLTFRLKGSIETQRDFTDHFYPAEHTRFVNTELTRKGKYIKGIGKRDKLSGEFATMYNKAWDKHLLMANFAYNLSQDDQYELQYTSEGHPNDKMNDPIFSLQYEHGGKPSGREDIVRDMSFTSLVGYAYDNRFMADLTVRGSGSSKYSPKKRWGAFWGLGLGWNVDKEAWMADQNWLTRLKLRASVGTTGAQNVSSFTHMVTYQYYGDNFYNLTYGDLTGSYIMRMANQNLKWQRKQDINAGFDATLLNRFSVVFDYYVSTTKDLIIDFSLPYSTGYMQTKENVGDVENKGLDLSMVYRLIDRDDFYLNVTGALNMNRNKLKKLSDAMRDYNDRQNALFEDSKDEDNNTVQGRGVPALKYVEGGSMSSIWAVRSLGIDPNTGREVFLGADGTPTFIYSARDQVIAGDSKEKYRGNFGLNGEWKGVGFSVTCWFLGGGDYYNNTLVQKVENANIYNNVDRRVFTSRWSEENRNAAYKGLRFYNSVTGAWESATQTKASTRFVQKRNELSISAVSAYYDLGKIAAVKRAGFGRLRLMFNMNDIHTFSSIKIERGTQYPFARTMSLSLTGEF